MNLCSLCITFRQIRACQEFVHRSVSELLLVYRSWPVSFIEMYQQRRDHEVCAASILTRVLKMFLLTS